MSLLTKKYGQNIDLYWDDGLAAFNAKPREMEQIKKGICKVYYDNDLKTTVEANTTKVNFLDVHLTSEVRNTTLTKKRATSHHQSIKNPPFILESINKSLSDISSDGECFDNAKGIYQEALD